MSHYRRALGDVSLVASAYLTPMITTLNATRANMIAGWHPTGFYTPDQIRLISQKLIDAQKAVLGPLDSYRASPSTPGKWTANLLTVQLQAANSPIIRYVQAANAATQMGKLYVDAPGFRDAVINAYSQLVLAATGLRGLVSADDFWANAESIAAGISQVFVTVGKAIMKIGGIAASLASAAVNQVLHLPDEVALFWKLAKWGALAYGGWWAYKTGTAHRGRVGWW